MTSNKNVVQKKIEKSYQLSDSSINEYGFRLLTEGYQLAEFQKNPIGYYMHERDNGVVLKWDDLRIDGDKIIGVPVVNMANERGEQTYYEAMNGFLNAASMGHIVVLEYSNDTSMMLPGQTGPTITKWYNKECSLVDIPGNANSLTTLYDNANNEISLKAINNGIVLSSVVINEALWCWDDYMQRDKTGQKLADLKRKDRKRYDALYAEKYKGVTTKKEASWSWDDYQRLDKTGKKLAKLKAENPKRYSDIFSLKFVNKQQNNS